jgi:serine/threonine protein kinase
MKEWMERGLKTYSNPKKGIKKLGWKLVPPGVGPTFKEGAYGNIKLAYNRKETGVPLESRHLAIAKVQQLSLYFEEIWSEVQILRGIVHENIIDCYGVFAVDTRARPSGLLGSMSSWLTSFWQDTNEKDVWIMLEYASAGDLNKEIERYWDPDHDAHPVIPESGALYYMKQICAGVKHLHDKHICHRDLHPGNILLKYKSDNTKVCMITDFGLSMVLSDDAECFGRLIKAGFENTDAAFQNDCLYLQGMVSQLVKGRNKSVPNLSREVQMLISPETRDSRYTESIDNFLSLPWFKMKAVVPIPKAATPLLDPHDVEEMGYLPPLDPAGTLSPGEQPVRQKSLPDRMRKSVTGIPSRLRAWSGRSRTQSGIEVPAAEQGRSSSPQAGPSHATDSPHRRQSLSQRFRQSVHNLAHRKPSRGASDEESPAAAAAAPGPSRSDPTPAQRSAGASLRDRTRSLGQAMSRPFRRNRQ